MRKFLSILMVVALIISTMTTSVFAASGHLGQGNEISEKADNSSSPSTAAVDLMGYIGTHPGQEARVWGTFTDTDPSAVTVLSTIDDKITYAAATAGNVIYGFNNFANDTRFYTIDRETMTKSYNGATVPTGYMVIGMAYDYTTNTMYAIAFDNAPVRALGIYTVDRATGTLTFVNNLSGNTSICTFAIDNNGNAFGIGMDNGVLYSIDLASGECTAIGSTGEVLQSAQSMTWDMNTNQLLWAHYYDNSTAYLLRVNTENGSVENLGTIGTGAQILGLCSFSDISVPEPVMPQINITFVDGYTQETIGTHVMTPGTPLSMDAYPEVPIHDGMDFVDWDYSPGSIFYQDTTITARYINNDAFGWFFESDPAAEGWVCIDQDGDGHNWMWLHDTNMVCPEGRGFMNSQSYINSSGALTPDNWLISPPFVAGDQLSFMFAGQDTAFSAEPIGVYISTDGGTTWSDEIGYYIATHAVQTIFVDTAAFEGQEVVAAFRHYNVRDQYSVNLDAVRIVNASIPSTPDPITPTPEPTDVHFLGYIAKNPGNEAPIWGGFTASNPGSIENLNVEDSLGTFGSCTVGDKIYGYNYVSATGDTRFFVIDTNTMVKSYPAAASPSDCIVLGMAYDYSNNELYAMGANTSEVFTRRNLYRVDIATGLLTLVGNFNTPSYLCTFAIDDQGNGYGIGNNDGVLYRIDLSDASCTPVGSTGETQQFVQSMTWDMNTNRLYWAHYSGSSGAYLLEVDPETASVRNLGTIGNGAEVLGICTVYTDAEIPDPTMPDINITFVDSVDGNVLGIYTMQAGSSIPQEAFPTVPAHSNWLFAGWDYFDEILYEDTTIVASFVTPGSISWNFESDPVSEGWKCQDRDGDYHNWVWIYNDESMNSPEGLGCMQSESYNNLAGPLTPDNWLISPAFVASNEVSFMLVGQDPSYPAEPIGIYVSTDNGRTWSDEIAYFVATSSVQTLSIDTSAYAGQAIKLAFRHYGVTDLFAVNLDAVEVHYSNTIPGDVDGDGDITAADATIAMRMALNLIPGLPAADYNGNGLIEMEDATLIMRRALNLID